jgi:Mrp family chromosome partitioning ATPase
MQYLNSDIVKNSAANLEEAMNREFLNGNENPTQSSRNQPERRATAKLDYYKKLAELQQMNLEFGRNIREAQQQVRHTQDSHGKASNSHVENRKATGSLNGKNGTEAAAHPLTTAFHVATKSNGAMASTLDLPTLSKPLSQSERVTASLDFNRLLDLQRRYDEVQNQRAAVAAVNEAPANGHTKETHNVIKAAVPAAQAVSLSIEDRLAARLLEAPAPRLPLPEKPLVEERKLTPVQPHAPARLDAPALPGTPARKPVSDLERRVSVNPSAHYGLETVPTAQRGRTDSLAARAPQSFDMPSERLREALLDPTRIDPHLISLSDLNPRAAKYYDQVAVSLIAISYKRLLKRVLITSALHGEGRTSVALNLAGALARARQRVLVVDCDLLNPSVLRLLGLDAPVGLSEAVRRGLTPNAATLRVQPAAFNVMPMREKVSHSAELLASPRFHELIQLCEADYDFLLFDSSPLLESPDANLLAGLTDATLMVIRPGYSTNQQMAKAVSLFNEKDICGVVLNRVGDQK